MEALLDEDKQPLPEEHNRLIPLFSSIANK
jgi:hypothetical protein